MSCTEEEFKELLSGESHIDMRKLQDVANHGVPERVRADVWRYLLEISKPDKAGEDRLKKQQHQDFQEMKKTNPEVTKKVRNQLKRFRVKDKGGFFQTSEVRASMENIIATYTNYNTDIEYQSGMLFLLGPLVYLMNSEDDAFFCFIALMKKIEQDFFLEGVRNKVARFMMYFRSVQPELFNHFEEEEISSNDWATSWLQYLLSCELPIDGVLRLWDTYFAGELGLDLHIYVCLAIIINCADELLELESSEIMSFLHHLPIMDMDKIIAQAYNIRDEIMASAEL
eukprot:TRINITY_DN4168_c0_g1_i1.p1 TRINITY_DN4168_c0_g1~~TRINITY_DN4168_c0_g1_i1.p1  ORF type:complete len:284 (-),score=65.15 TRINITY_DN4168_c0_g1_i1:16-867(-)